MGTLGKLFKLTNFSIIALIIGFGSVQDVFAVTFDCEWEVDFVDDPGNLLGGAISIGDTGNCTYKFDPNAADQDADANEGGYAYQSMSVEVGPLKLSSGPAFDINVDLIFVGSNPPASEYGFSATPNPDMAPAGLVESNFFFSLSDADDSLIPNTSLPTSPPNPVAFDSRIAGLLVVDSIISRNQFVDIRGFVTSIEKRPEAVGGEFIGVDTTALLVSGSYYTAAWLIPAIVSAIGIGIVIARKF